MSASIVSARKRSPLRPVVQTIDKRMPGFYSAVVISPAEEAAVARLVERRFGPDSEVAQMLAVSGAVA